jgi:toxin ParE1/3/4
MYLYIAERASPQVSRRYLDRIRSFIDRLQTFPMRGSVRDEIKTGLRMVGFERRVTIAFVVEGKEVVVLRVLYGGRQFDEDMQTGLDPDRP